MRMRDAHANAAHLGHRFFPAKGPFHDRSISAVALVDFRLKTEDRIIERGFAFRLARGKLLRKNGIGSDGDKIRRQSGPFRVPRVPPDSLLARGSVATGSVATGSVAAGSVATGSVATGSVATGSVATGVSVDALVRVWNSLSARVRQVRVYTYIYIYIC
jgi:hypothetical protein